MTRVVLELDKGLYSRFQKKKEADGFGGKKNEEWIRFILRDVSMTDSIYVQIAANTRRELGELWMKNLGANLSEIRNSEKSLRDVAAEKACDVPAIIVGGGPSVWQHNHLQELKAFKGVIIATDRMFIPCLREGLKVDYVVSIDGHPDLIWPFFDDVIVETSKAKILLVLQTNPNTLKACKRHSLDVYWFHTMQDNPKAEDSSTRSIIYMTMSEKNPRGVSAVPSGGNCGATALAIAIDVLKHKTIGLIGFDFGYPDGVPAEKTSYYSSIFAVVRKTCNDPTLASAKTLSSFSHFYHPVFKEYSTSDPVFDGYRLSLYEMLSNMPRPCKVINATEGGTLYSPGLFECMTLKQFLGE